MTDAEEIRATTTGRGWEIIKGKLDNRVLDLQNINNLDIEKPETIGMQIMARKMAADLVFDWLKLDVYGAIEARDTNITHPSVDESYIDQ